MASSTTPISGAGSSAESIGSEIDLNAVSTPDTEVQEQVQDTQETVDTQQQETTEQQTQETEQAREDGRRLPQTLRGLKDTNPEAYKAAKGAFFENLAWKEVFPSIQVARETSDLIKSVGGKEGLSQLREDGTFFKEAASQFLKGDPAFIKDLWEEDPIAAALHVSPMLETFKARDLEGYKSTVARLWDNEFQQVGFGPALKNLQEAAAKGDKEAMQAITKSIVDWYESIGAVSRRAEDPRVKTLLAERAKQHETRQQTEHQDFLKSYRTETTNLVVDDGAKVFDSFFKDRKIDKEDRNDLLREALNIANRAVLADKSFVEQRDKHLEAGDSHSAQQLTKARYAREFPDAVKRVARRYGMVSGTPGTKQQQTQPGNKVPGTQVEQGWTAVNVRPSPEEVDRSKTSNDMILSGRAILKSGKKVDWSKLKKQ